MRVNEEEILELVGGEAGEAQMRVKLWINCGHSSVTGKAGKDSLTPCRGIP
jgi:hypothetical protein